MKGYKAFVFPFAGLTVLGIVLAGFIQPAQRSVAYAREKQGNAIEKKGIPSVQENVYSFVVQDIDGKEVSLSQYQGKVLLIVNTASLCGFTPQLGSLEKLYETYKARGLEILAFPANDFMNQEPGTNQEIKDFCFRTYKTTYPLFSKMTVRGKNIHPLYVYLTQHSKFPGPITWNFNKFFVNTHGEVVKRFGTRIDPMAEEIIREVEKALPR